MNFSNEHQKDKVISVKVLIEGEKVQGVGYRIFLLQKALESGIDKIYARNINVNKVEVLVSDEEYKIQGFYEVIDKERPKEAKVKNVKKEAYTNKIPIPSIDRYLQFLTVEQLGTGREEVVKLPDVVTDKVGRSLEGIESTLKGMDEKFGRVAEKFGLFAEYAKEMSSKLTGMDKKLDKLPKRIAEAIGASETKKKH